jgi:hypothetical protein
MKKVSPCPVCQKQFSSYGLFRDHFKTDHREWQRVLWRTRNYKNQRKKLDQRLEKMKLDEEVCKNIVSEKQKAIIQVVKAQNLENPYTRTQPRQKKRPYVYVKNQIYSRKWRPKQHLCEGGGILTIKRNVTLPAFGCGIPGPIIKEA